MFERVVNAVSPCNILKHLDKFLKTLSPNISEVFYYLLKSFHFWKGGIIWISSNTAKVEHLSLRFSPSFLSCVEISAQSQQYRQYKCA